MGYWNCDGYVPKKCFWSNEITGSKSNQWSPGWSPDFHSTSESFPQLPFRSNCPAKARPLAETPEAQWPVASACEHAQEETSPGRVSNRLVLKWVELATLSWQWWRCFFSHCTPRSPVWEIDIKIWNWQTKSSASFHRRFSCLKYKQKSSKQDVYIFSFPLAWIKQRFILVWNRPCSFRHGQHGPFDVSPTQASYSKGATPNPTVYFWN